MPLKPSASNGLALGLRGLLGDDLEHAGELGRAHHRALRAGPGEEEARVEGAAVHAVVAGAVGRTHDHAEVRDGGVGDGVDHLGAVLDDPALLVVLADHVAGRVVQEQQRGVGLVGELDELRRLLRLLGEQHPLGVGEDADRVAVQLRPAGHERRAVERLELVERLAVVRARAVDDPDDHLARVERLLEVGRDEVEEAVDVSSGSGRTRRVPRPACRGSAGPRSAARSGSRRARPRRGSRPGRTTRACISAPPSDSSSDSSPVAIFTSGGPPRKTFAPPRTNTV